KSSRGARTLPRKKHDRQEIRTLTQGNKGEEMRVRTLVRLPHMCLVALDACRHHPRRSEASRQEQPQPVSTTQLSSSKYATETFLFSFHFIVLSNGPNALSRRHLLP